LCGLAIQGEDVVEANLGDSTRPYSCDFLGYGSCLAEYHVGEDGGTACADMSKILISLALLKLRSRL
jgi:hypothetical protein